MNRFDNVVVMVPYEICMNLLLANGEEDSTLPQYDSNTILCHEAVLLNFNWEILSLNPQSEANITVDNVERGCGLHFSQLNQANQVYDNGIQQCCFVSSLII